ncbi:DUF3000 domain-containing protein [Streptomyces albipurpureus]|uniref:DUF3000 domain-containing protein n=1 Tax=Streptomyces albipurpureus TaxID=2897419 RepID=A0ABT0UFB8_9ACTN|nr:DUF3000 domain-containing protein [Streptomyces sp. CWNU-1]MCM2387075.1 DUF3000 domain-containing protein [Streptomyces sp. CWNU-1]
MAAAQGRYSDHSDQSDQPHHAHSGKKGTTGDGEDGRDGRDGRDGKDSGEDSPQNAVPRAFQLAVEALQTARLRPGIEVDPTPPPKRLAPYAYALEAAIVEDEEDLADGRLVLLHDPAGHDAWQGTFRLVTLLRAELEPEMAADPLLPEVSWSWLTGAMEARGLSYGQPSGTVTRAGSHYFGGLSERRPATQIEIRASWTPREGRDGVPDTAAHLAAWCDLLCQIAGLPPAAASSADTGAGVVSLPQRRGPQHR